MDRFGDKSLSDEAGGRTSETSQDKVFKTTVYAAMAVEAGSTA